MKTIIRSILATFALAPALTLALTLAGCGGGGPAKGELRTLDLEAAIDNPRPFDLTDIATEIDFIPLDDSQRSGLVGNIVRISESKRGFHIYDDASQPVKLFDRTGEFVTTQGSIGRGPNEINSLRDIAVDYETGNLYAQPWISNTLVVYDADGRMVARSDSIHNGVPIFFSNRLLLSSDSIYIYSPDLRHQNTIGTPRSGMNMVIVRTGQGQILAGSFGSFVSNNGDRLLVKKGRNDTVFVFDGHDALDPAYILDMGKYTPPDELIATDPSPLNAVPIAEWSRYYSAEQMYEGERYMFVALDNGSFAADAFVVLDRNDPSARGFSATGPDGARGLRLGGVRLTPLYFRDGRLTGSMQALDIVDNRDAITHPGLAALAATLTEESNPVIVVARLK